MKMEEVEMISTDKMNSVEFNTSVKGVWSWKCKAYGENLEDAFKEAVRIGELCDKICFHKNIGKQNI